MRRDDTNSSGSQTLRPAIVSFPACEWNCLTYSFQLLEQQLSEGEAGKLEETGDREMNLLTVSQTHVCARAEQREKETQCVQTGEGERRAASDADQIIM